MKKFDILIIGNGVLGLSTGAALLFQDSTVSIGVIGPKHKKNSGTLAAGAMLGAFGEITCSTLATEHSRSKLNISIKASRYWEIWLEKIKNYSEECSPIEIKPGTHIILNARSSKQEDNNFRAIIKTLDEYEEDYDEVFPQDIPGLNPTENNRPLRSIFIPNEGSINPHNLLEGLESIISKGKKSALLDGKIISIKENKNNTFSLVTADNEQIEAKKVVIAAGSCSQKLIDQLPSIKNRIPRLLSGVGTAVILNAKESNFNSVVRSPNRFGACGMHIIPKKDTNQVYMGASNTIQLTEGTESRLRDQYYLLQRTIEQFQKDFHNATVAQWLVGNRPVSIDLFPLAGGTSIPGLFILTGTYRDGINQSPIFAEWMANEILTGTVATHLFRPERKPISTLNREDTISAFVEQHYGSAYEHEMQLPKCGWENMIQDMFRQKIIDLYDKLDINIGLPIDLLIMLFHEPQHIPYIKNLYQSHEHQPEKAHK